MVFVHGVDRKRSCSGSDTQRISERLVPGWQDRSLPDGPTLVSSAGSLLVFPQSLAGIGAGACARSDNCPQRFSGSSCLRSKAGC